jgi:hypothetical protein
VEFAAHDHGKQNYDPLGAFSIEQAQRRRPESLPMAPSSMIRLPGATGWQDCLL